MLGRRGPLSKIIGGTTGAVQEYRADRKARREGEQSHAESSQPHDQNPFEDDDDDGDEDDDEELAQRLDAAQLELVPTKDSGESTFDEKHWVNSFIKEHPPPAYNQQQPAGVLPMPVLIPQRRSGQVSRGFIRAYAPVLGDAGIDQNAWIEFLKGFEKSIGNNKYFHVVNGAVWVAGKVRMAVEGFSIIARFVTMAIHLSIEGGRRMYMNSKENTFLDRMNEEYFKPRGLYALLITYKPNSKEPEETLDITTKTVGEVGKRDQEARSKWKNLLSASAGKMEHEEEVPEFASLVFPALDNMDDQKKQNAVKHFGSFMADYTDRRSQAKFDGAHEDSKLAGLHPDHHFASRYSDPNHPASQSGLVSTLSGGNVQYKGPLQKMSDRRNARKSKLGISRQAGREGMKQRRNKRPLRKFLTPDAVYLMVVNYPTKEEQELVLEELEQAKKDDKGSQMSISGIRKTLGLEGMGRKH